MKNPITCEQETAETLRELEDKVAERARSGWIADGTPREVRINLSPKLAVRRYVQIFIPRRPETEAAIPQAEPTPVATAPSRQSEAAPVRVLSVGPAPAAPR